MMKLDNFIGMMTGCFDNKEQFNMMQAAGKIYPYAVIALLGNLVALPLRKR